MQDSHNLSILAGGTTALQRSWTLWLLDDDHWHLNTYTTHSVLLLIQEYTEQIYWIISMLGSWLLVATIGYLNISIYCNIQCRTLTTCQHPSPSYYCCDDWHLLVDACNTVIAFDPGIYWTDSLDHFHAWLFTSKVATCGISLYLHILRHTMQDTHNLSTPQSELPRRC